jgi:hypothetical protein
MSIPIKTCDECKQEFKLLPLHKGRATKCPRCNEHQPTEAQLFAYKRENQRIDEEQKAAHKHDLEAAKVERKRLKKEAEMARWAAFNTFVEWAKLHCGLTGRA